MKKLFLPFLLVLFFVGCETESTDVDDQNLILELNDQYKAPKTKVDICHITGDGTYQVINISENAVAAHMAHGDKYTYSPEGSYYFYYTPNNGVTLKGLSMFDIIDWNGGTSFEAEGYNLNNNSDIWLKADFTNQTEFSGIYSYFADFSSRNYHFNGTVDECGGIISITGDFYGPVPSDSPVWIDGPNPF